MDKFRKRKKERSMREKLVLGRRRKKLLTSLIAVTAIIVTLFGGTINSQAAGGFSARYSAPSRSNQYYYSNSNIFYKCGYGMPNCTAYAYGRVYEITGKKPKLCTSNAGKWFDYNKKYKYYGYGSEPRVGAVACWTKNGNNGHVAIVEKVDGNKVTISESHYRGKIFDTRVIKKDSSDYLRTMKFQGYIYTYNADTTPPTASNLKVTKLNNKGYRVTCNVSDNKGGSGIQKVLIATWTEKNGQDDLVWSEMRLSGNKATFDVKISEHNFEKGRNYISHIYVYDNCNNVRGYSSLGKIYVPK